ncbi:MAG TPA: carbohydrate porin [Polyangiaceae bacterium]|nr:carbohydrate porin [Polyangiaceae bacterium]
MLRLACRVRPLLATAFTLTWLGGVAFAQTPAPPPGGSDPSQNGPPAPPPGSVVGPTTPPLQTNPLDPRTPVGPPEAPPAAGPPGSGAPAPAPAPPAAAPPAPVNQPIVKPTPGHTGQFEFGSYGRATPALDGRGGPGRNADIVAFGTRLDEDNYAELEFRRADDWTTEKDPTPITSRIVATLAVTDPLFHYTGKFDATLALRNLFIEEKGIGHPGLALWVGSRMYRGDDIYLLNWWPLDNLNTLGGGARLELPSRTKLAVHAGVVRLDDPFQYQAVARPLPYNQLGATRVAIFDRPRVISSFRAEQIFPLEGTAGIKVVGYGELHHVAKGVREREPAVYEQMPSDGGFVAGLQVGAFAGQRDTFVNLFFRYARGLAAYGDFTAPYELADDRTSSGAHEVRVAMSANWEGGPFTVLAGGYVRSFRTAAPNDLSFQNVDEAALVVRPHYYFTDKVGVFVEGTAETQQRAVLFEGQGRPVQGTMFRAGVAPFLSPAGKGSYRRPQIRAIYLFSVRDRDARSFYPADDPFARRSTEHFVGLSCEWWFNSSYL